MIEIFIHIKYISRIYTSISILIKINLLKIWVKIIIYLPPKFMKIIIIKYKLIIYIDNLYLKNSIIYVGYCILNLINFDLIFIKLNEYNFILL